MDAYRIIGGRPLCGTARVAGAKNAALPILAASLLADGPVELTNVPQVTDVNTLCSVLRALGVSVQRDETNARDGTPGRVQLLADHTAACLAPEHLVSRMRASFCVLGPLLARRGRAVVSLPGGCNLGDRPVDLHLKGLAALGADIRIQKGYVVAEANRLQGAEIDMHGPRGPTVTGTANVMMAAALAAGVTRIRGAAREPEIVDLGRFLNRMGADIEGLGESTVTIRGVSRLAGCSHRIIPDRIEAATMLLAAAITGGEVTLEGVCADHITAVSELLQSAGATITREQDLLMLRAADPLAAIQFAARPFPHMPTDLQPQLMALSCVSRGTSRVEDRVFPARWRHAAELRRMGAQIEVGQCRDVSAGEAGYGVASVVGVEWLLGARVQASDLRAGVALVLAGLAAQGETIVTGTHHIDRGYQRLEQKLCSLGADIERVEVPDSGADTSDGMRRRSRHPHAA